MGKEAPKAAETAVKDVSEAEPKFELSKLRENCGKLFGVDECTFVGATYALRGKKYSISEIKETINEWKAKEAK